MTETWSLRNKADFQSRGILQKLSMQQVVDNRVNIIANPHMTETGSLRNKAGFQSRGILKKTFFVTGCGQPRKYYGKTSYNGNMVPKK